MFGSSRWNIGQSMPLSHHAPRFHAGQSQYSLTLTNRHVHWHKLGKRPACFTLLGTHCSCHGIQWIQCFKCFTRSSKKYPLLKFQICHLHVSFIWSAPSLGPLRSSWRSTMVCSSAMGWSSSRKIWRNQRCEVMTFILMVWRCFPIGTGWEIIFWWS